MTPEYCPFCNRKLNYVLGLFSCNNQLSHSDDHCFVYHSSDTFWLIMFYDKDPSHHKISVCKNERGYNIIYLNQKCISDKILIYHSIPPFEYTDCKRILEPYYYRYSKLKVFL